ncbi:MULTISPECIES: nuclear transport factor 2 family protein [unclassified Sphingobacterium]|uniref:nuclear transport factor 2 family protein n=2 Tax=Sphingobacterium TaxID=28453 RepID=UPI0020C3C65E|nr:MULTISPECIES: nuclear transport factor 2 family protein [unclassified Sphingobacterium]
MPLLERLIFKEYFDLMDANSIFIGSDATERWDKQEFMDYAKPHFDKGKAWNFSSLERNIEFSEDGKTAWIDELLNTQMKICRGSGVLVLKDGKWLIKQYVLSMTVPNDLADEVVKMKADIENGIIEELKLK